jgi:asparagine synthase (glutamine-hydrolysing)
MCGIAGVVSPDGNSRADSVIRGMLATLRHRGPDDEGVLAAGNATLGARRLSIIDLSTGHQPMQNEDANVVAVQNGEIYNFAPLRDELRQFGHTFRTQSDTEILPHAYEQWGPGFVGRLRGMFAVAIWDAPTQTLVLARDRFGKKPLFYTQVEDAVVFASELQALLTHPLVPHDVDDQAIDEYLTFGYISAPRSAFAHIRKVPAAHVLTFRRGIREDARYWKLAFTPKLRIERPEAEEEVRRLIDESVQLRMISDVPIGAFLSGGLDSSTVVAHMARHSAQPVKTFSIGFQDTSYDELAFARIVADAFGTDHHEFVVDERHADMLPMLVRHLGEPFADSSIVPTYQVARLTKSSVTVALNGDGGDEMFGGYDRYRAALLVAGIERWVPRYVTRATRAMTVDHQAGLPRTFTRALRFASAVGMPESDRYLRWGGYFRGAARARIVGARLADRSPAAMERVDEASRLFAAEHPSERFMATDVLGYLPDDLLVKVDIASMACSLEARSPLLDHKLVEFVAQLPTQYKLSTFGSKKLLRGAMRGIVPDAILDRRRKMGFSAPVGAWLRGPLRQIFADTMTNSTAIAEGYVDAAGARALFSDHVAGRTDGTMLLWNLFVLELWFREVVVPLRVGASTSPKVAVS